MLILNTQMSMMFSGDLVIFSQESSFKILGKYDKLPFVPKVAVKTKTNKEVEGKPQKPKRMMKFRGGGGNTYP